MDGLRPSNLFLEISCTDVLPSISFSHGVKKVSLFHRGGLKGTVDTRSPFEFRSSRRLGPSLKLVQTNWKANELGFIKDVVWGLKKETQGRERMEGRSR